MSKLNLTTNKALRNLIDELEQMMDMDSEATVAENLKMMEELGSLSSSAHLIMRSVKEITVKLTEEEVQTIRKFSDYYWRENNGDHVVNYIAYDKSEKLMKKLTQE